MGQEKYANGFHVTLHEDCLNEPLAWRQPHTIFVCSMSDLFHQDVPFEFVDKVMHTILMTPQHRYQLLTKRADRMAEYFLTNDVPQMCGWMLLWRRRLPNRASTVCGCWMLLYVSYRVSH